MKIAVTAASGQLGSSIVAATRLFMGPDAVVAVALAWVIGRNGIYIEPDIEYIGRYQARGEIANCAADGRRGYVTRPELAFAYARMLTDPAHFGRTYRLHGEPITQATLAQLLSEAFGVPLAYRSMDVEDYLRDRVDELGSFIGTVIAGIYQGIRDGAYDCPSDFETAAGRPHRAWSDYFAGLKR